MVSEKDARDILNELGVTEEEFETLDYSALLNSPTFLLILTEKAEDVIEEFYTNPADFLTGDKIILSVDLSEIKREILDVL